MCEHAGFVYFLVDKNQAPFSNTVSEQYFQSPSISTAFHSITSVKETVN